MDNFKKRISLLQAELKAPKNLYNNFGKYSYRNAEGILEAVKPLLVKYAVMLTVEDEIILVGDRYYVKASAILSDTESNETYSASAYAREEAEKRGMDGAQVTGSTSSYARKYALNGLFLLDDTKDADTDEFHTQTNKKETKSFIKSADVKEIETLLKQLGFNEAKTCSINGVNTLSELSADKGTEILTMLRAEKKKRENA